MKNIITMLLAAVMLLTAMPVTTMAADDDAMTAAQMLYDYGLFQGTGQNADGTPNFDLEPRAHAAGGHHHARPRSG